MDAMLLLKLPVSRTVGTIERLAADDKFPVNELIAVLLRDARLDIVPDVAIAANRDDLAGTER
ncbi:hypothetical protein J27TS7_23410 [Paenibacillus dendritiformis]|nr:hypothetical protein J27TS7_23410 [Paenibacillus dendritiformis]